MCGSLPEHGAYRNSGTFITKIGGFTALFGEVQSICHPFAIVIFKIITEQRKGSEHAEQSADSLPMFLFMTFLLVLFFQRDQQNVQPFFQYHVHRSAMWFLCWCVLIVSEHS